MRRSTSNVPSVTAPAARPWSALRARTSPLASIKPTVSGLVLARSADHGLAAGAVTLGTLLVLLRTKVHPLLLMGVGAVLGLVGLI
ncbi:MAG: hypothetical protein NVSMB2_28800 [Chloroflexota bacterium]